MQRIKDYARKKGLFIRITRSWPGEEKLGEPMDKTKKVTKEECEREIRNSLKKNKNVSR